MDDTTQVDLCVFLAGNNLNAYVLTFFDTLYKCCDISNIHLHVVEKGTFIPGSPVDGGTYDPEMKDYVPGVGKEVHDHILGIRESWGIPVTIYEKHDPTEFFLRVGYGKPFYHLPSDHANTLNWAMDNCGTNKWIIFCHSDVVFIKDAISFIRKETTDVTGLFGEIGYCFAVNREAYHGVGVKFNSVSSFYAVPATNYGSGHIVRHINDPECIDRSIPLWGWDTGELLAIMMTAHGWRCSSKNNTAFMSCLYHGGSGHGYSRNKAQVDFINSRLDGLLTSIKRTRL